MIDIGKHTEDNVFSNNVVSLNGAYPIFQYEFISSADYFGLTKHVVLMAIENSALFVEQSRP